MSWPDVAGTRAESDDVTGGYQPCSTCVIEASSTYVVLNDPDWAADLA